MNFSTMDIVGDSVDVLVKKGLSFIKAHGERVSARGLEGLQAYNVQYILTNPRNRVHTLRLPDSVTYFAKELICFFSGTLRAADLGHASSSWLTRADAQGNISSNYGYHIFHQQTPEGDTQYEWVVRLLAREPQARRAVININELEHKQTESKDMPCAMSAHFFIQENKLCCVVSARATDIVTGLCYNMGFFSFVTELVFVDLQERGLKDIELGYCMMKSDLTQLYNNRPERAALLEKNDIPIAAERYQMPSITSAQEFLEDIRKNTAQSASMQWCLTHQILQK